MMGWPQVTMIALMAVGFTIHLIKHGEPSKPYNVWSSAFGTAISVWLLCAGGFFG